MKVKCIATGGIQESKNPLVTEQWKKHPESYLEIPDAEPERPARPRKSAE